MIKDVAHWRYFGTPCVNNECELNKPRKFLHLKLNKKGINAVIINDILNNKGVQSCILPYFKMKATPLLSYIYASTIASKLSNHKQILKCLGIKQLQRKNPKYSCSSFSLNHSPSGHIMTRNVNTYSLKKESVHEKKRLHSEQNMFEG
jgi:hypothetical protein